MISVKLKGFGPVASKVTTMKVWPAEGGGALVHPVSGPLRDSAKGTSWAADAFTYRRIADGSLLTAPPAAPIVSAEVAPAVTTQDVGSARKRIINRKRDKEA
jgi:hypothetical protein